MQLQKKIQILNSHASVAQTFRDYLFAFQQVFAFQ